MSPKRNPAPEIKVGDTVKIVRLASRDMDLFGHLIGKLAEVDFIAAPVRNNKNVIELEVAGYGFFACSARELEVVL